MSGGAGSDGSEEMDESGGDPVPVEPMHVDELQDKLDKLVRAVAADRNDLASEASNGADLDEDAVSG